MEDRVLIGDELDVFSKTKSDLYEIFHEEEIYWQLRSKIQWLKAGDSNTIFFSPSSIS
jgi:hypothetical protein